MKNQLLFILSLILIIACNTSVKQPEKAEDVPTSGEEWFNKAMSESDTLLQIMYYTNAINLGPNNFQNYCSALNNRATTKRNLRDYRGAIDDYTLCIESCPEMTMSYSFRGECKLHLNQYQNAISDFDQVINSDSQDFIKAGAFLNKGICIYNLGNMEAACKNWSIAGQLGSIDAYNFIKEYCQ